MPNQSIAGFVETRYEPLREAFAALGEPGAALAVTIDGEVIVDLWTTDEWDRDTLVHVFSATKPVVSLCVLQLIERGKLALDDQVISVWPEFEAKGKGNTTIRQLLANQAVWSLSPSLNRWSWYWIGTAASPNLSQRHRHGRLARNMASRHYSTAISLERSSGGSMVVASARISGRDRRAVQDRHPYWRR